MINPSELEPPINIVSVLPLSLAIARRSTISSSTIRFRFLDPIPTATMSDEGEKVCPLCAEEMDLTDQQLKPCKCGYEICVWCWHQIMDLAEKDNTEGRCPACRIPYNKERIVGMAAKCERFVEKKVKSKSKSKTLDGRKQLSNVRVVQRNLVYIMGLPLNLADEDLLQRKEYFAQYGKVLKVSISRTSAGTIQPFPNNTCSVYITYSKEEEAVRCIQFVHGFTLEGRPLRACFGTTKYCHQWLKNAPCSNPDCLYLHEIGSAEVSFTKDEVISSYTRSRVQQITGATYDNQLRSGNVLPPPAYDYCNNIYSSSENLTSRSATNHIDNESDDILASSEWQTPASSVRGSPPKNSSGRSVGLPAAAAWGMRASNSQQPSTSVASSNEPSRKTPNTSSVSISFSTAVASPAQVSTLHGDSGKKVNGEIRTSTQKVKLESGKAVTPVTPGHPVSPIIKSQLCTQTNKDKDDCISISADSANSLDISEQSCGIVPEKDPNVSVEVNIPKLSSDMLSMHIDGRGSEQRDSEQFREPLTSSVKETCAPREKSESRLHGQTQAAENAIREVEDDLLSFDVQRLKDPELVSHTSNLTGLSRAIHLIDNSRIFPPQAYGSLNGNVDDPLYVNTKFDEGSIPNAYSMPVKSDGYHENRAGNFANLVGGGGNYSYNLPTEGRMKHNGGFEDVVAKNDIKGMGESSIISNILSMDFDSWGESLASPQNLAKLLGETEKQQGSLGVSSSWKVPTSNQSRFSFAREEDQLRPIEPSLRNFGQPLKNNPSLGNRDYYLENVGYSNGFSAINAVDPGNFPNIDSHYSSNKFSVSRGQVSAPPGFSGPSRAPPPGFATHERVDQAFDVHSGSHSLETSYLRNPYQAVPAINMNLGSPADIEFMDPAILAVGKGRLPSGLNSPGLDLRSTYSQQINNYENEARLQLLMQRSLTTTHQNQIYGEMGENYSSHSNGYGGVPSRMMEQTLTNNVSQFSQFSLPQSRNQPLMSNGHWGDGWSEVQHGGSDLNMAELLRNERLGMNKYFNGYEDSKFRLPSSGDLFNHRSYGI